MFVILHSDIRLQHYFAILLITRRGSRNWKSTQLVAWSKAQQGATHDGKKCSNWAHIGFCQRIIVFLFQVKILNVFGLWGKNWIVFLFWDRNVFWILSCSKIMYSYSKNLIIFLFWSPKMKCIQTPTESNISPFKRSKKICLKKSERRVSEKNWHHGPPDDKWLPR